MLYKQNTLKVNNNINYHMNTLTIKQSNELLIKLINNDKPFYIARMGVGPETMVPVFYKQHRQLDHRILNQLKSLDNNNGIYAKDIHDIEKFCKEYIKGVEESTCLAAFPTMIVNEQEYLRNKTCPVIHNRVLEPFYCCLENVKPWTHYLLGKKILIVHPFVDSFRKQLSRNFQIFKNKDKRIFLDGQEFLFYKCFVTTAGNHSHSSWIETFEIMCNDISKFDFDIALLGCGGYGLPLSNYIHKQLNKGAIYVGGGLQLLFGVMGKRWENNDMWKTIINENDTKFIRPSGDEIIQNKDRVEGGCFW